MLKKATVTLLSFLIISSFVFAGEKKEYSKALECIEEIEYHYPNSLQALLTKSLIEF